jgi:hypothetical protein
MRGSPEPSEAHFSPEASSPSQPMLTMVGLGPPLLAEESLLAGTTAYLDDGPVSSGEQRTLVGFPPAPAPVGDDDTVAEPEDTPNDAVTAVASYDEITVVTRAPIPAPSLAAKPVDLLAGLEPPAPPALDAAALTETPSDDVPAPRERVVELDFAELVESEPELKIVPPSLESFVPPPRRFAGGPLLVGLVVAGGALTLAALVRKPAAAPVLAVQNRVAPELRVPTPALAPAPKVPSVDETSAAEVISVRDLRLQPEPSRANLASVQSPPVPVDLDSPSSGGESAASTLTIMSTPPCNVVLDGRPLGPTPQTVSVSPGAHSVVFVHPSKGRKSMRVETAAGKAAVASVGF